MESIFTPANLETNLRMKKEEIISNFRNTYMKNGTTHGTVEAFKNLFSASNPVGGV
jgi:TFIIF-interacting CTD phosphatase-like protein